MNRSKFFDLIRNGPFPGSLTADQVAGTSAILDEWDTSKLTDQRWEALVVFAVWHRFIVG